LTYLLGDHLGSTSITTDSNGALLMETRYKPFGEVRYATTGQTLPTKYTFAGQYSYVSDEATDAAGFGLMYFGARFYDPVLGRFSSADSLIPGAGDPQAWDRYAFVNNNPTKYTDPTGHSLCEGYDDGCEDDGLIRNQGNPSSSRAQPWRYSKDVVVGFHIGPTGDIHVPNYDDDSYNGSAWVSNRNRDDNFWVRFNLTYDEAVGITISDMTMETYSDYPVTLEEVLFETGNTSIIPKYAEYGREMPSGFGSAFDFPAPPGPFDGTDPVIITIEVGWIVNTGHGPFQIAPDFPIYLPPLPDAKYFIQTGQIPQHPWP
jgi:RHS repeat-associated protein